MRLLAKAEAKAHAKAQVDEEVPAAEALAAAVPEVAAPEVAAPEAAAVPFVSAEEAHLARSDEMPFVSAEEAHLARLVQIARDAHHAVETHQETLEDAVLQKAERRRKAREAAALMLFSQPPSRSITPSAPVCAAGRSGRRSRLPCRYQPPCRQRFGRGGQHGSCRRCCRRCCSGRQCSVPN